MKLYQLPTAWGVPNLSPFCIKVETYPRMAGLEFEIVVAMDPRRAPKGKYPYLEDDGRLIPDSGQILEYLQARYGSALDLGLSDGDRAIAHLIRRTLEESLYFSLVHSRWNDDAIWPEMGRTFFGALPPVVRSLGPRVVHRGILKSVAAQGTGRHTPTEVFQLAKADISAVATILGDRSFVLGEQPRSIDAVVYAFFASLVDVPLPTKLKAHAESLPNVVPYCARMKAKYYAPKG